MVYGVGVQGDYVWVATAAGAGRLDTRTGQWALFNERNTPMYEIWTYNVSAGTSKVYYAVWGGGILEYDVKTGHWKDYNDPDGETEMVVQKDQGLIHEITTSVSYVEKDKILWVATYFGAQPLRRPQLEKLPGKGQRAAQQFPQPGESRGRNPRLVLHRQRPGLL